MTLTTEQKEVIRKAITSKVNAIRLYSEQLEADAVKPRASYDIDGESVDRNKWRHVLMELIEKLQKGIIADERLINRTPSFAWMGKPASEALDYDERNGLP